MSQATLLGLSLAVGGFERQGAEAYLSRRPELV